MEVFIPDLDRLSPESSLILIGTAHNDPRSFESLSLLLEMLKPDRMTVEISPDVVAYRQSHGRLLLRKLGMILERLAGKGGSVSSLEGHPGIVTIRKLLSLPYEFRAASSYATKMGIEVQAIDHSEVSLHKLRPVEERLVSVQHLKRVAASPDEAPVDNRLSYALARNLLSSADAGARAAFLQGCRGEEGVGPRDRHLAGKIRPLMQSRPGRVVHIGGWVHLIDDPRGETLYSLLKDFDPCRILLDPDHPLNP